MTRYQSYFTVHRRDTTPTARQYLEGLFACEKGQANMERMEEEVAGSEYRRYQHFVSNSPWNHEPVLEQVARETPERFQARRTCHGTPTGYIVDESAHLKQGMESVGVSRQYAGVVGKVDNCQVGVYSSLCNDRYATLITERLFLPTSWAEDAKRCKRAGIPPDKREPQSKPQQALAMIDENLAQGIQWDWIGGDGLYGHRFEFTKGLDERALFYVLDVHKDELVYLEEPQISGPPRLHSRGRPPTKGQTDGEPVRLDRYCQSVPKTGWEVVKVRKTTKGWLRLKVHLTTVWMWDGEEPHARRRTLLITNTLSRKPKIKYSVSNGTLEAYTSQEYAYFQAQRYWVERCLDDAKNELGLSDYQVRKWRGWHHHHALVMMACAFVLEEKLRHGADTPLLSVRDARLLIIARLWGTKQHEKLFMRFHSSNRYAVEKWGDSICYKTGTATRYILEHF